MSGNETAGYSMASGRELDDVGSTAVAVMLQRRSKVRRRLDRGVNGGGGFMRNKTVWLVAVFCVCFGVVPPYASAARGQPPATTGRIDLAGSGNKRRREGERARRSDELPPSAPLRRTRSTNGERSEGDDTDSYGAYDDDDDEWDDDWSEEALDGDWDGTEAPREAGGRGKGFSGWGMRSGKPTKMLNTGTGMLGMRERLNNARRRASRAYREAKSLMSSEMEGVVLKATRPDDLPVKPKHLEALMRPTTEMPKEFNVYLPVVRKLWSKMADKEWRVAAKALYIVHRFAADGSSEHAVNLKESVAVLRTHHDSRRKVKYFDMETICDVKPPPWTSEDVTPLKDFLKVYAEYVLQRTTQFGTGFAELVDNYAMVVGEGEMLSAVSALLSAGQKCVLRKDQERAVTVAAAVQVVQDLRDMLEVCAAQLDFLVREGQARDIYPTEVDSWYEFLNENHEDVAVCTRWANELATRHNLSPAIRPLVATPLVLKFRQEEVAVLEMEEAAAAAQAEEQQSCPANSEDESMPVRPQDNADDTVKTPAISENEPTKSDPSMRVDVGLAAGMEQKRSVTTKSREGVYTTTTTQTSRAAAAGVASRTTKSRRSYGSGRADATATGEDVKAAHVAPQTGRSGLEGDVVLEQGEGEGSVDIDEGVASHGKIGTAERAGTAEEESTKSRTPQSTSSRRDPKETTMKPKKIVGVGPTVGVSPNKISTKSLSKEDSAAAGDRRQSKSTIPDGVKENKARKNSSTSKGTPSKTAKPAAEAAKPAVPVGAADVAKRRAHARPEGGSKNGAAFGGAPQRARLVRTASSKGEREAHLAGSSATAKSRPKAARASEDAGTRAKGSHASTTRSSGRSREQAGALEEGASNKRSSREVFSEEGYAERKARRKRPAVPPKSAQQARGTE